MMRAPSPSFRKRIKRGDQLLGTLVSLSTPEVAELMARIGYDWLFIDLEHGGPDLALAQRMLQAVGDRCHTAVRVPALDETWIKKCLDFGPDAIIVPQVNSAAQAEQAVRLCKYPPAGTRGVGIGRAQGYGLDFDTYVKSANDRIAVIVQIEHVQAVAQAEAIAAVPGVDVLFIGPYDLSASMGLMGQVGAQEVVQAIQRVAETARKAGKALGFFGLSAEAVRPYLAAGYQLIAVGQDLALLGQAAKQLLAELRPPA